MKVKVKRSFIDLTENVERKVDEVFECPEARFNEIKTKLPQWVESVEEPKPATPAKATKAKSTSKKGK